MKIVKNIFKLFLRTRKKRSNTKEKDALKMMNGSTESAEIFLL